MMGRRVATVGVAGKGESEAIGMAMPVDTLSLLVLLISHLFHPLDHLTVELLLNCDVRHRSSSRSSVPVLFARRKPDNIAGLDFFNRAAISLRPAKPSS